jgi:multiple sugar transport system substrate-binding protein
MKRYKILFIGVAAGLFFLTCLVVFAGGDKSKEKTTGPVTINVLTTDQNGVKAEAEIIEEFEQATGINVEVSAPGWEAWYDKMVLEISGGSSAYDVYEYDALTAGVFLRGDGLTPMDDFINDPDLPDLDIDGFIPGLVEFYGMKEDGSILGVPWYHSNIIFAYRKDIFESSKEQTAFKNKYGYELKPPSNWTQFGDICEFFTRDTDGDGEIDFWGTTAAYTFGIAWDTFSNRVQSFQPFKDGEWWFDKNWNPLFSNQKSLQALSEEVAIYRNGWVAPGSLKKSWGDVQDEFRAGNTALSYNFSETFGPVEIPDISAIAGKVGYFPVPKYERNSTILSSWMVGINSKSKYQKEAYQYIAWKTSKEIDKRLVTDTKTARRLPCRIDTHYDPEVLQLLPFLEASAESFDFAVPWPLYPEFMELYEYLSNEIQNAITETKTPEQALNDAADKMIEVMRKAGKL